MGAKKKTKTKAATKKTTATAKKKATAKKASKASSNARATKARAPLHVIDATELKSALERASSVPPEEALEALLSAWGSLPASEMADAIAVVPLEAVFADVTSSSATDAAARLDRLADTPRDPRVSDLLVSWVADPPYHATSSKPFHKLVFSELTRHADPRAIVGLRSASQSAKRKINGNTMRTWVFEEAARTIGVLREQYPEGVPSLPRGLSSVCKAAKRAVLSAEQVGAAKPRLGRPADALLEAIRNDPTDDGARAVYADHLIEKGDPRGEFITLQLQRGGRAPTPEEKKRELTILRKHLRRWLAELGAVVGSLNTSDAAVGPRTPDDLVIRFERGFLAECWIVGSEQLLTNVVGHPYLATLEVLSIVEKHCGPFLTHPVLRHLSRLATMPRCVPFAIKAAFAKTLQGLSLYGDDDEDFVSAIHAVADGGVPALRELKVDYHRGSSLDIAAAATGIAVRIPSLESLTCIFVDEVEAAFTRLMKGDSPSPSPTKWQLDFTKGSDHAFADRLRALCH